MAKLVGDVAPFDITEVAHPAHEFLAEWIVARGSRPDVPDTRHLPWLLPPRRERPRRRRAADKGDELAPLHHSITSVAHLRLVIYSKSAQSQIGSIPCALMTEIAVGPLRKMSKSRAASADFELVLTAPAKLV